MLVTKYRKKCFTDEILTRLEIIFKELCIKWEITLEAFNGEQDHIYLLLNLHPNILPSVLINNLKTASSRLIRKEFAPHFAKFYLKPTLWTRAYCLIAAGGAPLDFLKEYIQT